MTEFKIQGTVLSKVPCQKERRVRAELENKSVEEIPLTYGSIRIGINIVQVDNITYGLERFSSEKYDEERFILEISYRYDIETKDGSLIKEHEIINKINQGDILDITLDNMFTKKKHNRKIIKSPNKIMKCYFTKTWADSIIAVESARMITPRKVAVEEIFSKISNSLKRPLNFSK